MAALSYNGRRGNHVGRKPNQNPHRRRHEIAHGRSRAAVRAGERRQSRGQIRADVGAEKEIEDGAAFDIALLPRPELDALAEAGKIVAGTQTDITRSAVGLAVRAGAPKPDIGTVAALRQTLQRARTIGYSDGPSGAYIADLLVRLGIADEMKPKTRLTSRPVAEIVAEGEAEIGMQQIVAILPVKGAELVGPLPGELQNIIVYAAGIAPGSGQAARALVAFWPRPRWCA